MSDNNQNQPETKSFSYNLKAKPILAAIFLAIFVWFLDSIVDYLYFSNRSFLDVLVTGISSHELFSRIITFISVTCFASVIFSIAANRMQLQKRVEKLNRILTAIRNVNQLITQEKNKKRLLNSVCTTLTETQGFNTAWIVLLENDQPVEPFYHSGFNGQFGPMAKQLQQCLLPSCAQRSLATGELQVISEPDQECLECPFSHLYENRSSLNIRLEHQGKTYGWLTSSIEKQYADDVEFIQLFEEVGEDIAYALWNIDEEQRSLLAEIKFASLLTATNDAVIQTDLDGNIIYFNFGAEKIFHCKADKVMGTSISRFCPKHLIEEQRNYLADIRTKRESQTFETERITEDGVLFPVEITLNVNLNQSNKPYGYSGIVRDITERKQTEQEKIEAYLRQMQVVRAANVGLWDWDLMTDEVHYSAEWKQQIGYEDHEISNHFEEWQSRVHPDDLDITLGQIEDTLVSDAVDYEIEFRFQHKNGSYRHILAQANIIRDEEGNALRVLGSHIDITERKHAEEILLGQKRRYENILEGTNTGTWEWNVQTDELIINQRWAEIIGYTIDELSPVSIETWKQCCHPDDFEQSIRLLKECFSGEVEYYSFEYRMKHKDGSCIWIQDRGKVVSWTDDGEPLWMFGSHQDITERKLAEQELRDSEERFRALFERSPMGVAYHRMMYDDSGKPIDYYFIDANDNYLKLTGVDPRGKTVKEAFPGIENDQYDWIGEFARCARDGETIRFQRFLEPNQRWYDCVGFQCAPDHFVAAFLEITEEKELDDIIKKLVEVSSSHYGESLFESISLALVETLNADHVMVGEIDVDNPDMVQTISFVSDGKLRENKRYSLKNSPCETVIEKNLCVYESEVCKAFPYDVYLNENHIEGYAGVSLKDSAGKTIGVFIALFNKPIEKVERVTSILQIFSARIGSEIERLRIDRQFVQHMQQYHTMLESSLDGFWVTDLKGNILKVNPACIEMTGYSKEEFHSMSIRDFEVEETDDEMIKHINKIIQTGYDCFETKHRCKNGDIIDVEISTTSLPHFGGRFYAFVRNITQRKKTEHELQRLQFAIEQAEETIVITNLNGDIVYTNPAFQHSTGYALNEVIGQNPRILQSGKHDKRFYQNLWDTLLQGKTWSGRFINKKKNGELYTEEATICPVRDPSGVVINYVGVKRDITDELLLQEQFQQSQKMESIGNLAGGIAHDFNNMLGVILGHCDIMLLDHECLGQTKNHLDEIKNAAIRSADLTSQLLAFARKQTAQPTALRLNEVIEASYKIQKRLIGENIEIKFNLAPDAWAVHIDKTQIDQILFNMLVNARDAIDGQGKITIETSNKTYENDYLGEYSGHVEGKYVELKVTDTGCGMSEDTMSKLFDPFYTTKPEGAGTGLGLSTVFGIVKQNNGHIDVKSRLDIGSTFTILFPRYEIDAPVSQQSIEQQNMPEGNETILLVEDDEALLKVNQEILTRLGYTVHFANTPNDAINIAKNNEIDLVLSDVIMPEMNGRELWEHIREITPKTKCLFISGYTDDVLAHHGVLDEGVNFVSKPVSFKDLSNKLRWVLDN
jgi:PAS domain S-box-containing protein